MSPLRKMFYSLVCNKSRKKATGNLARGDRSNLRHGTRTASGGPLFPVAGKAGKRARRNQWFLHFLARYNVYKFADAYHTFTQNFRPRLGKRIVSASASLPLMSTLNTAFASTVAAHERQRRRKKTNSSYATIVTDSCEREVKGNEKNVV